MIVQSDTPFRHWVFDNEISELSPVELTSLPDVNWDGWVHYNNDCENGKRTCNWLPALPDFYRHRVEFLLSSSWVEKLRTLSGVEKLDVDLTQWGGGLHVTNPGGWLNCHLDWALRNTGVERRVNAIAFLNPCWEKRWGGEFQIWDSSARNVVCEFLPCPGRVIVWESSDLAYHGTAKVSSDAPPRVTAAAWYLAPARPGCTRKRALFVPRREPS